MVKYGVGRLLLVLLLLFLLLLLSLLWYFFAVMAHLTFFLCYYRHYFDLNELLFAVIYY